jgi:hypothetical protein
MRIRRTPGLCFLLVAVVAALAAAQDTRKVGLTMGYPASFGVLWHVSDKMAIRPELSFGGSSSETIASSTDIEGDNWSVATGASVLVYPRTYDHLRTYIAPRLSYVHSSSTSTSSSFTTSTLKTTTNAVAGAGLFGAEYALGDRFKVFGEIGFGFTHSSSKAEAIPTTGSGNSWGTRTGIGVVFYP